MNIFDTVFSAIGSVLGYLMWIGYKLFKDYGLSIVIFTILTKIVMFPISLLVQKNSIKMVKMKPRLDALRYQHIDSKDDFYDAQARLYKEMKYSPMAGVWPLLLQIPIIFGLIDVVYKPLRHLLHLPADVIGAFVDRAGEMLGTAALGSSPQMKVVELLRDPDNISLFSQLQDKLPDSDIPAVIESIRGINTVFLGVDLSQIPVWGVMSTLLLIPLLSGLSALTMCVVQNKINVLQIEQSRLSQWGMTIFMIAFSSYFAFLVPAGVGLYWICGNLFSIAVMWLVNLIYNPRRYIDYTALEKIKQTVEQERKIKTENARKARVYYKKFCRTENLENMKLMFYSEQSGFYKYFSSVIRELIARSDLTVHYVTSDPDDQVFSMNEPRIIPYYIDETRLIPLMMKVEADMVVMTTPDLEKYHIKRSKVRDDVEYVFIDHGCTSDNLAYRTGALDAFDTILAISPNQIEELRAIERLRGTKKKTMVKCGYGLIDDMIAAYEKMDRVPGEKPTILIAPSWQYDNIMDSCLDQLLEGLVGEKWRVVVRPHPQYVRRFPANMEAIIERYKDRFSDDFIIETDFSSNATVYTSDLVITDWSGIAYEFSFTTDKPSLFVNTEMKVVNKQYELINMTPVDITYRDIIGVSLEKDELGSIAERAEELLSHQEEYRERISKLKKEHFFNLGRSGEACAKYIISRIGGEKK